MGFESKLKSKLIYDRRSVGQSVLVSGSHDQIFFSVWRLWVSWCVAPSLTRGWVCNVLVQLHLGLARAVTLGSKSRRTHHILLSHLRLPQRGGPGPCIYIPQEQGGPVIPPSTALDSNPAMTVRSHSGLRTNWTQRALYVQRESHRLFRVQLPGMRTVLIRPPHLHVAFGLNPTPWRRKGEWIYRSTLSWPRQ
jgi:hypothetical protein